jgi:hypothetical protein
MVYWSEFDLMNIILYYSSSGEIDNAQYIRAKTKLEKISEEERDAIVEWWSKVTIVGEEESKLALSLVQYSE